VLFQVILEQNFLDVENGKQSEYEEVKKIYRSRTSCGLEIINKN
jgi:hypothetical protein